MSTKNQFCGAGAATFRVEPEPPGAATFRVELEPPGAATFRVEPKPNFGCRL